MRKAAQSKANSGSQSQPWTAHKSAQGASHVTDVRSAQSIPSLTSLSSSVEGHSSPGGPSEGGHDQAPNQPSLDVKRRIERA